MEILRFENVSFRYQTAKSEALQQVCFTMQPCEFLLLCGESGCGKSTLLQLAKPELRPAGLLDGKIWLNGQDSATYQNIAGQVGFVWQDPEKQIVTDKVWHELAFGLENAGMELEKMRRRVAELSAFFGIQDWMNRSTDSLSGGEKQILNLASVLMTKPKLLLLDEPMAQLDPIAAEKFLQALVQAHQELGVAVLLCEHRLERLFGASDRVAYLEEGRMVHLGTPQQVAIHFKETSHPYFAALPTPLRVAAALKDPHTPMTLREGKAFLQARVPHPTYTKVEGRDGKEKQEQVATAIEVKRAFFRYEKAGKDILRDCSVRIPKSQIFCIVGGNGTGKTTLLKLLGKKGKPYRGRIDTDKTLRVGWLPQNPQALFTKIQVKDELEENWLTYLKLSAQKELHPYDLSGGEQQRLALGKILAANPDVILLDEPSKGLDPFWKGHLGKQLRTLCKQGKTIVMVSHDIEFAARYSDCCAMLFDGEIVAQGSTHKFFKGNQFYTTQAARMSQDIFENAILEEDVIQLCHKNAKDACNLASI